MVSTLQVALGLALLLGVVDYMSEGALTRRNAFFKERFVSFVAGLSVTYIFLHLFPLVYSGAQSLPRLIFIFMLLGFVTYHLIEKWIYKHVPREKIGKDIEREHAMTLFFYHFSIGIVFISLIRANVLDGLLFFVPVSLHVIVNALPHSHRFQRWSVKAFFSSAPFLGAVLAVVVQIPQIINFALLGVVAGLLLFLEAREVIPKKREGSPLFFILGVLLYGLLIIGSWSF